MSQVAGTLVGPYKLRAALGAGGMGVVWAAEDVRLGRGVALKFLPTAFSSDPAWVERFKREAQTASALNHPNICTVHDVGSTPDGSQFIVMELLEGKTLRTRLDAGPIPPSQAVDWALEIARGLQAAHARGIVHRDLKPENLFLTSDGRLKILDFGLARIAEVVASRVQGETLTSYQTVPGLVLGTVGYMAPEQVRGEPADHRADIFAFGAIVYEMISGRRAFHASSAPATMHAILEGEPPELQADAHVLSTPVLRSIRRCLEKSPDRRFQSTNDLAFAFESLSVGNSGSALDSRPALRPRPRRAWRVAWSAVGLALVATALYLGTRLSPPAVSPPLLVLSVLPPAGSSIGAPVLSPDGRWLAFAASGAGRGELWVRPLDSAAARPLPGTDGAANPFWSPDSRSLGFFADGQLKVISLDGGPPRSLCGVQQSRGGSWNPAGEIIFTPNLSGPIQRIAAAGGTPVNVTELDASRSERTHRWPSFLPDGRHFLYFVRTAATERDGIYLGSLDGAQPRRLLSASTNALYARPGVLLFVRDGTLMAQPFDAGSRLVSGSARPLVEQVGYALEFNRGAFSVSDTGTLAYGGPETRQPTWFSRDGLRTGTLGEEHFYAQLWLSPDGRQAVLDRPDPDSGANDIVMIDVASAEISTKVTTHRDSDVRPIWIGPDRIAWASNRTGVYDLFVKRASGDGSETVLFQSPEHKYPAAASPDGRWLLFESISPKTRTDIWVLPLDRPGDACRALASEFDERQARLSPDGRWIAYVTDRDGRAEVYVTDAQAMLRGVARRSSSAECAVPPGARVSAGGGTQPMWRGDAGELFYLAADGQLMSVPMSPAGRPGRAAALFTTRITDRGGVAQRYVPAADGQSFLVITPTQPPDATTVVLNWAAWLGR